VLSVAVGQEVDDFEYSQRVDDEDGDERFFVVVFRGAPEGDAFPNDTPQDDGKQEPDVLLDELFHREKI